MVTKTVGETATKVFDSKAEFDRIMQKGFEQAKKDEALVLEDAFKQLKEEIKKDIES